MKNGLVVQTSALGPTHENGRFGKIPTIVCDAIQGDASAEHIRISAHSFLPKTFSHHRDVGALFFRRQKIATANRTNAENIEIIRSDSAAEDLGRIAQTGQAEGKNIFAGKSVENRLAIAVM